MALILSPTDAALGQDEEFDTEQNLQENMIEIQMAVEQGEQ